MASASLGVIGRAQHDFRQELEGMLNHFKLYENKSNQAAALAQVPKDFLMAVTQAKFDSSAKTQITSKEDQQNVIRDMFLLELMSWFKNDYFKWMDSPSCPHCSGVTVAIGHGVPTPEELSKSAGRVEIFTCRSCFRDNRPVARFVRYNHPAVLLETREGRCGEWANCFALICRALGFEVRHVRDWSDHVWIEVFCSSNPNRWVHVDPCENSYDSPLLYDKGWGKKLSYVIAVSQDDIQDVTWRYVQECNTHQVLAARNLISEAELVTLITSLRKRIQSPLGSSRIQVLQSRLVQELVEFLYPRPNSSFKDSEQVARESGSLAWRLARQELGSGESSTKEDSSFTFEINEKLIQDSKYLMTYNCAKDEYNVSKRDSLFERKGGWRNCAFKTENIFRKVEHDWKMVYLARKENSSNNQQQQATISWNFKITDSTREIVSVKISAFVAIFQPSAKITITLVDDKGTLYKLVDVSKMEGVVSWDSSDGSFQPCNGLVLTCTLRGGEGNTGWQHAQLFRQSLNSIDLPSLSVELKVIDKNISSS